MLFMRKNGSLEEWGLEGLPHPGLSSAGGAVLTAPQESATGGRAAEHHTCMLKQTKNTSFRNCS